MADHNLWNEVIKGLGKHCSEQEIETWLKPLSIVELRGDLIILEAPNKFYKNWVENKYLPRLKSIFKDDLSMDADVSIITGEAFQQTPSVVASAPKNAESVPVYRTNLNTEYTFENFVACSSNQFAHSACLAVSEGYYQNYNPLFIYGGTGLGKTHLMHAVGNKIVEKFPKLKVLHVNSETFTNEMINALRNKKMEEFRDRYRNIDMLLFDDVQFIAGKQRTTEEFFYTFNTLYDQQKHIIITSDKTPNEIPDLEERLRSRFAWGLMADIQAPSVEEKTAIIQKRAQLMNIELPNDVSLFIAESIASENVRELIGALVRLGAFASFNSEPISIDLAKRALEKFLVHKEKVVTADDLLDALTGYFNVKIADLRSKKRSKSISFPRQIGMYLLRNKLNMSLQEIGDIFGGRDHSTVLHSVSTITDKLKDDVEVAEILEAIERKSFSI